MLQDDPRGWFSRGLLTNSRTIVEVAGYNALPFETRMHLELIDFELADGSTVRVEVDGGPLGIRQAGGEGSTVRRAAESFEQAIGRIKPLTMALFAAMQSVSDSLEEVTVQFGLKMNGQVGVILAAQSIEANFQVTAKWRRTKSI